MASALYKAQTPNGAQSKQNPWFLLQTCPGRPPISVQAAASSGAQALPPAVPPAGSFSRHRQHPQHLPCPSPAPGRQPGPLCCTPVPNPQIPFNSVNHCPLCSELPVVSCFSQSKSQPSYNGLKAQRPCQPLSPCAIPCSSQLGSPLSGPWRFWKVPPTRARVSPQVLAQFPSLLALASFTGLIPAGYSTRFLSCVPAPPVT